MSPPDTDLEYTHVTRCPRCGRDVAAGTRHECEQHVPILDQFGMQIGVAIALNPFPMGTAKGITMKDIFEEMLEGRAQAHTRMKPKDVYDKPFCHSRPVVLMDFVVAGMSVGLGDRNR